MADAPIIIRPAAAPANVPAVNFEITDELALGKGGEVQKFNDNLEAIRTLKLIESEGRRATPPSKPQATSHPNHKPTHPASKGASAYVCTACAQLPERDGST